MLALTNTAISVLCTIRIRVEINREHSQARLIERVQRSGIVPIVNEKIMPDADCLIKTA